MLAQANNFNFVNDRGGVICNCVGLLDINQLLQMKKKGKTNSKQGNINCHRET